MDNPTSQNDPDLAFLTPDRVLDVAYCGYLVSANNSTDRPLLALAASTFEDFKNLCARYEEAINSPEWRFLTATKAVVVSLSRGIERRRFELDELERRALQEREHRVRAITQSTRRFGFIRGAARTLMLGGFGYLIARTFIPWIDFDKPVQPTYASLAMALGTMLVGEVIKSIVADHRIKAIYHLHDGMIARAQEAYRRGAKEEYIRAKMDAARIWTFYMGKEPVDWPGYETVLEEEHQLAQMMEAHRLGMRVSPIARTLRSVGSQILERFARRRAV